MGSEVLPATSTSPFASFALSAFSDAEATQKCQEEALQDSEALRDGDASRQAPEQAEVRPSPGNKATVGPTPSLQTGFWEDVGTPGDSPLAATLSAASRLIVWEFCTELLRSSAPSSPATPPANEAANSCKGHARTASRERVLLPWDAE